MLWHSGVSNPFSLFWEWALDRAMLPMPFHKQFELSGYCLMYIYRTDTGTVMTSSDGARSSHSPLFDASEKRLLQIWKETPPSMDVDLANSKSCNCLNHLLANCL